MQTVIASPASATIVAIPAKDEAGRIAACLVGLNDQSQLPGVVILLINNASDSTESVARALRCSLRYDLRIVTVRLPPPLSGAGHARRLAMTLAANAANGHDILLTTDADGIPSPEWMARNVAAIRAGADVVCGRAVPDWQENGAIPADLHHDLAQEHRLVTLLDDMAWILDPEPHDPPARHAEASGASLAVTVRAFRRAGGVPAVRSGEDRAFVSALWRLDAKVRHDPSVFVSVSGRLDGRASGGMADTLKRRMLRQDADTDARLEPATDAWRRFTLRQRVRSAWRAGQGTGDLAYALGVSGQSLKGALAQRAFGMVWARLEAISPTLRRRRVRFADLPAEIIQAETLMQRRPCAFDAVAAE